MSPPSVLPSRNRGHKVLAVQAGIFFAFSVFNPVNRSRFPWAIRRRSASETSARARAPMAAPLCDLEPMPNTNRFAPKCFTPNSMALNVCSQEISIRIFLRRRMRSKTVIPWCHMESVTISDTSGNNAVNSRISGTEAWSCFKMMKGFKLRRRRMTGSNCMSVSSPKTLAKRSARQGMAFNCRARDSTPSASYNRIPETANAGKIRPFASGVFRMPSNKISLLASAWF